MPFWAYMLHCNAGRFYTGHTDNLDHRIADHKAGRFEGFTKQWLPVELVWSQEFPTRHEAKATEQRIKGWSRAKKLALIPGGDWEAISRLAKSKGSPTTSSGQTDVIVAPSVIQTLHAAAAAAHPREACGILLGEANRISAFVEAANVHPTPETHFEIDPQALIDAYRAERAGGPQIAGYFHSHPSGDPAPSATDRALAGHDGRVWAILGGAQLTLWRDDPEGFQPLSLAITAG